MGTVYSAFDRERGAYVALKIAHRDQPEALLGLKREFRALGRANHPNLLSIYELSELGAAACLIGELIRGERLLGADTWDEATGAATSPWPAGSAGQADLLGSEPAVSRSPTHTLTCTQSSARPVASAGSALCSEPMPPAVARDRFGQLAAGLRALHAAGYAHRDIKPGNVLVTDRGRVVLVDFGAVARLGATSVPVVGTDGYIAPEAFAGGAIAPALDWYAFGVLLYQALTGRAPTPRVGRGRVRPSSPALLVDGVPEDLDRLCRELLAPDPEARPGPGWVAEVLGGDAGPMSLSPGASRRAAGLVGRRVELSVLRAAYEGARAGRARLVRVRGDAGMGKTSLIDAFVDELDDAVVLRGPCFECATVAHPALDSLADSVCEWLATEPADRRASLLPRAASVLPAAFPVLAAVPELQEYRPPQEAGQLQLAALRRRARVALRELLGRAADSSALVLVFDDLQWGDRETAAFLRSLLEDLADSRVLVVCAHRGASAPALRWLGDRDRGGASELGGAVDIELHALPEAAAETLARRWLDAWGGDGRRANARDIARASRGNPYFVRELARLGGGSRGLVPGDVVLSKVDSLGADARELLRVLALVGRPVSHDLLRATAGQDGGTYLRALKALRAADLATQRGLADTDLVEVFHSHVREAVTSLLSPTERTELHRRIAAELDGRDDASPDLAVDHWLGAGDQVRASRVAVRAARQAARVFAFDRAATWCRLALDIGGLEAAQQRTVLGLLAHTLECAGDVAASADALVELTRHEAPAASRRLRYRAGELLLRAGHVERGRRVLFDVLAEYGVRVPASRTALAAAVAEHKLRSRLPERFSDRAATADGEPGRVHKLDKIDALWSGAVGMASVDPIVAGYLQARNYRLAVASGDRLRIMQALWVQAFISAIMSNGADRISARDCVELADELAHRLDDARGIYLAEGLRGLVDLHDGRYERAAGHLEQACAMLRERVGGSGWDLSMGHIMWACAAARIGNWRVVADRLPEMLAETEGRGQPFSGALLRSICVRRWLYDGTADDCRRELARARQLADRSDSVMRGWISMSEAIVELGFGRPRRALDAIRSLGLVRRQFTLDTPSRRLTRELRLFAHLALARGDRRARARLRLELARFRRARQPSGPAVAALVTGQLRCIEGDFPGAATQLRRARAEFAAVGMGVEAAVARDGLGRLEGGRAGEREQARARHELAELGVAAADRALAIYLPLLAGPS